MKPTCLKSMNVWSIMSSSDGKCQLRPSVLLQQQGISMNNTHYLKKMQQSHQTIAPNLLLMLVIHPLSSVDSSAESLVAEACGYTLRPLESPA